MWSIRKRRINFLGETFEAEMRRRLSAIEDGKLDMWTEINRLGNVYNLHESDITTLRKLALGIPTDEPLPPPDTDGIVPLFPMLPPDTDLCKYCREPWSNGESHLHGGSPNITPEEWADDGT